MRETVGGPYGAKLPVDAGYGAEEVESRDLCREHGHGRRCTPVVRPGHDGGR